MPAASLETLHSPRLRGERLSPAHFAELLRMHRDPAVMQHLGGLRDEAQTLAYLDANLRHWDRYGHGLWIVYEKDGTVPIGRAVLRHLEVEGTDEVEVGYAFYPLWWGRGLATEIAATCLELGRARLALPTAVAVTDPANHGSQHVLRKCGLAFDRTFEVDGAERCLFRIRW